METYPLDLGKARALLDEAGYKPGKDGVRFALTLDFEPGLPEQQKMVAEYLKSQLRKVGIDVRLHASPDWSSWAERVSNGTHDMTLAITSAGAIRSSARTAPTCRATSARVWPTAT